MMEGLFMFGLGFKKKFERFKTVDLPGEAGTVAIPECFTAELESDETLLVCLKGDDALYLRFSSYSIDPKDNSQTAGYTHVLDEAQENGHQFELLKGKCVFREERASEEQGLKLKNITWKVGLGNSIVIVSASIVLAKYNSRVVRYTLDAMPKILDSIQISIQYKVIESDGQKVQTLSKEVDPWPQTTAPFGSYEQRWLEDNLHLARKLGLKYGSGSQLTPAELDQIYSRWILEDGQKEDESIIINALGAAFGECFTNHLGFDWIVINDEQGQEYGIYHSVMRTTAYPRSSIYKRIVQGETSFFQGLYVAIKSRLDENQS
jgi:hypothetical protein